MSQTSNNSLLLTPTTDYNCGLDHGTNEFAVVGDAYFPTITGDIPPVLQDLINGLVRDLTNGVVVDMNEFNQNLINALLNLNVAKNTYESYIVDRQTDFDSLVARLDTLNATYAENSATITQLQAAYANAMGAVATLGTTLRTDFGDYVNSSITQVYTSIANQFLSTNQSIRALMSSYEDINSNVTGNASAIEKLTTYTGMGTFNGLPAVIANSSFYRNLDAYLSGSGYDIGGSNNLIQDVTAISTAEAKSVEAKFAYNSKITIGDRTYDAGFGLNQLGTYTVEDGEVVYDSEFWINANKFKFTNNNQTGTVAPFTIDASGTTPKITFNGNVVINNRATALPTGPIPRFHGDRTTAPTTDVVTGDTYRNTSDQLIYTYTGTQWVSVARQTQVTGIAFLRSTTAPAPPSGGSYTGPTPIGWSDGIPGGDTNIPVYWTSRIFTSDGKAPQEAAWSSPVMLSNTTGVIYMYHNSTSSTAPTPPSTPNISGLVANANGWTSTPTTDTVWVATSALSNGVWSNFRTYKVKGEAGVPGEDGDRGAASIAYGTNLGSLSPSDVTGSNLQTYFTSGGGPSTTYVVGDNLILTNTNTSSGWTNIYKRSSATSSGWINSTALNVNGDAIVNGTLHASRITAGHIGTIQTSNVTGDILKTDPYYKVAMSYPGGFWHYYITGDTVYRRPETGGSVEYVNPVTNTFKRISTLNYTNAADTSVNLFINYLGRSGYFDTSVSGAGALTFLITVYTGSSSNRVTIANSGWTSSSQDAKSFPVATYTVSANTSYVFELWYCKRIEDGDVYSVGVSGNFSIIGVKS